MIFEEFCLEILASQPDRYKTKALYHLAKMLQVKEKELSKYKYKLRVAEKNLSLISLNWDGSLMLEAVKVPDWKIACLIDVFSPAKLWQGKGKRLYVIAKDGNGFLGGIRFTAPPSTISPRGHLIPALKGNGRSKDGMQEKRGQALNHFLWSNKSLAFGNFRASRGLKVLYMSVFSNSLYDRIATLWQRKPLAIETTSMYGISSKVFRGMSPLKVYRGVTEGFSSAIFSEALEKAWKAEETRKVLKHDVYRKGYYLISPFGDLPQIMERLVVSGELPEEVPTLGEENIFSKLSPGRTDIEAEKEWLKYYIAVEREVLKKLKEKPNFEKAFNALLNLHRRWNSPSERDMLSKVKTEENSLLSLGRDHGLNGEAVRNLDRCFKRDTKSEHKTEKEGKSMRVNQESLRTLIENIIEQKGGRLYEEKGYAWIHCPFHDDHNPSLTINLRTGEFVCKACGEAGSFIKLWQALNGFGSREEAIESLKNLKILVKDKPVQEAVYLYYHHKNGRLLYRKRKLRYPDGSKSFVIEHYDFDRDVWVLGKPKDCPPVLYNYEAMQLAREMNKPIFVVEGEKDVETLKSLGFFATTPGGANDWKTELAGEFTGLEVVLIPDNDPAGKQWLARVGSDIRLFTEVVRWIDLKEEAEKFGVQLPEKGDITDLLQLIGKNPAEVFTELYTKDFEPELLKENSDRETLSSSGLFLTKELFENLSGLEFLFEGFLPWGYTVVLSSEPGAGKSWLSLALAREAIRKGYKVVYLDGDNPLPYIKESLQAFGLMDELGRRLFYLSRHQKELCISPTDSIWNAVKTVLRNIGKSFIVVDTLGSMSRGFDPNSDKDMREVLTELKAIRDAGHAVLVLHHTQKYVSNDENIPVGQKYRGSGVIKSDADGLYFMEREGSVYNLYAGKLRFMGEQKLKFTLTADKLTIAVDQTSKKLKEAMDLLSIMEDGKVYKQKELVEWAKYKLGFGRDKVRELLALLEEKGYVTIKQVKGGMIISKVARTKEESDDTEGIDL